MRIDHEIPTDTAYRVSNGAIQEDIYPVGGINALSIEVRRLRLMVAQTLGSRPRLADRIGHLMSEDNDPLALINGTAHMLLPNVDARQQFLEIDRVSDRIEYLMSLLASAMLDEQVRR